MKKKLLFLFFIAIGGYVVNAQTFVSTDSTNKNVILEQFTGNSCTYCPDGHRVANTILDSNPGRVFLINIHTGGYASGTPNYTTLWGDSIANQYNIYGYPTGSVNRHVFSDSTPILSRSLWSASSDQILEEYSYVNVATKSTLDCKTRELTVDVEIYYTGNSPVNSNFLHVALLQNNILGPQVGMSTNPSQIIDEQYNHMHMLRHLLTGQWGDKITTVSKGNFITKQYKYIIPEYLNNVKYVLSSLEVVAFVSQTKQEIISGAKSEMTLINGSASIYNVKQQESYKCDQVKARLIIDNFLSEPLTSFSVAYSYNGNTDTLTLSGSYPIGFISVDLPDLFEATSNPSLLTVKLVKINGKPSVNTAEASIQLSKSSVTVNGDLTLKLVTDAYPSETIFKVFKEDGTILMEGGPWIDLGGVQTTERLFTIQPPTIGCYTLEVYDAYGDGINNGYGSGYFQVIDTENNIIINNDGKFGSKATYYIYAAAPLSIDDSMIEETPDVTIYPNPVNSVLRIATSATVEQVEIFTLQGQQVINEINTKEINVSTLVSGIYMIRIATSDGKTTTQKFVKE